MGEVSVTGTTITFFSSQTCTGTGTYQWSLARKGGKVVPVPLAPRTARTIDLTVGERVEGPIFVTSDGQRLDRHGAARIVRRMARRAEITKPVRASYAETRIHHRRA